MRTGITKIYLADGLGSTPARVNRITGELYLNREKWNSLDPAHRLFILLHEAGHVDLGTRNEIKADSYAFDHYANLGYPLSQSVKALTRVLHFENPQHYDRVEEQIRRAFNYDYHVNKNQRANPHKMENFLEKAYSVSFTGGQFIGQQFDDFNFKSLLPKKMRQAIETKIHTAETKDKARQANADADLLTAQAKIAKAEAELNKAKPPIQPADGSQGPGAPGADQPKAAGSKNMIFIAAGIAVVVIVLVIFFIKKKK